MVPLAVSGIIAIGGVVTASLLLLAVLLRLEARDAAAQEKQAEEREGQ
ncbi:MAG TPA: hypothetical protein VGN13_03495 [Solirubrobacteraceae bacterium]|jgi:hypothetical protein